MPALKNAGTVASHGGGTILFRSQLFILPEHKLGVVVLSNSSTAFNAVGYIGTQADKHPEAMTAMMGLIQDFPRSENGFEVAQKSLMSQLESERITKTNILFNYETAKRRGVDHDLRKDVYEGIQNMTIEDVANFQKQYIKGKPFNVVLVGDRKKLSFKDLQKYGEVKELTLDELFGYEKVEKMNLEKVN